jgi:hypothetical protein
VSSADAVARETAWLTSSGDGLPALLKQAGGPFDVVQAYWPRSQRAKQRSIFVLRRDINDERFSVARRMDTHEFVLRIVWPMLSGTGAAEDEQQALDDAIELVKVRVHGPLQDKTHGGRFLSVAENPSAIRVSFTDPAHTVDLAYFEAEITYHGDDVEVII